MKRKNKISFRLMLKQNLMNRVLVDDDNGLQRVGFFKEDRKNLLNNKCR